MLEIERERRCAYNRQTHSLDQYPAVRRQTVLISMQFRGAHDGSKHTTTNRITKV